MKQLITVLFLVLFTSCTSKKQLPKSKDDREWNRFELEGIVKTLKEKTYKANFDNEKYEESKLRLLKSKIVMFDSIGRYTKITSYDENNSISGSTIASYVQGKNYESVYYSKDNVFKNKNRIKYLSNKLILEESFSYKEELLFSIRVEKQNDRFSKVTLVNGDKIDSHFYYYTDDKFINNKVAINKNKDTISNIKYKYLVFDKNGNWTKRLSKNSFNKNDIGKLEVREISY